MSCKHSNRNKSMSPAEH